MSTSMFLGYSFWMGGHHQPCATLGDLTYSAEVRRLAGEGNTITIFWISLGVLCKPDSSKACVENEADVEDATNPKQRITMKTFSKTTIIIINISIYPPSTHASAILQSNGPIGQPQWSCSTIHHRPGSWPFQRSSFGHVALTVQSQAWVAWVGGWKSAKRSTKGAKKCPKKRTLRCSIELQGLTRTFCDCGC